MVSGNVNWQKPLRVYLDNMFQNIKCKCTLTSTFYLWKFKGDIGTSDKSVNIKIFLLI